MGRKIDVTAKFSDLSWGAAETDARVSSAISSNRGVYQGTLWGFKLTINNTTNNITFALSIQDEDGVTIYTSGAQADNGTDVVTGLSVPLYAKETVTLTPSGVPGVSTAIVSGISLYIVPDAIM